MGVNLKEEAAKLQRSITGADDREPGVISAFQRLTVRAYRVTNQGLVNKAVAQIEAMPERVRVAISRIRRHGAIIAATPDTIIQKDDVIAVMTHTEALTERGTVIGPEVSDAELLDFPVEVLDVVVTNKAVVGTRPSASSRRTNSRAACFCAASCASGSRCRSRWTRASTAATC
jgi:putative transport protein